MIKFTPLLALVFVLASCQLISPRSAMKEVHSVVPQSWAGTKEGRAGIDTEWVKRFGDQELNALVQKALDDNRSLQARAERLLQARRRAKISGAAGRPQLSLGESGSRQQSRFLGFPGADGGVTYNSFGVSLNASWELDLWGRVRAGKKAQVAAYEAQVWNLRAAEASLKAQVAKSWFALQEAEGQAALAQAAVEIRKQTRDAIQARFENALINEGGTGAQYRIAQSDVASAEAELARWQGVVDNTARQLELLVGDHAKGQLRAKGGLPKLPAAPPKGLPSELLLRRPDLLAAERVYSESLQRRVEATRALFPSLSLTGSAGTATTALEQVLDSSFGIWSIGGGVTQYLLTGGRLQGERFSRKSESKARLIELQDIVIRALGEVETALAAEQFLRRQYQAMTKAANLAKDAAEAAQDDYREGAADVQTLLSAETRYIQAASTTLTLQRLLLANRVDLHLALGGDYNLNHKR